MTQRKVLTVFGTRPEAIKLAPVIHEFERRSGIFRTVNVTSSQHVHLLKPFIKLFRLRVNHDLQVHQREQQPGQIARTVIRRLLPILDSESPDIVLVQGDTSTAVGAAEAASMRRIPVAHIEAGLRTWDDTQPFPEEIYRKRITELASYHFAPTLNNRRNLLEEGIPHSRIFVTGNTVVDSLDDVLRRQHSTNKVDRILIETAGMKRLVLTMHRRENMLHFEQTFLALRRFVKANHDVCILFPVHPNPAVRAAANAFRREPRILLLNALDYSEFIQLLRHSWVVVTDSGGIQEEAPTLGKTVLLLRAKTERPEAVDTGVVKIIGCSPSALLHALESLKAEPAPIILPARNNPFGSGGSAKTIVDIIENLQEGAHEPVEATVFQGTQPALTNIGGSFL